jgi:hypothetical protein
LLGHQFGLLKLLMRFQGRWWDVLASRELRGRNAILCTAPKFTDMTDKLYAVNGDLSSRTPKAAQVNHGRRKHLHIVLHTASCMLRRGRLCTCCWPRNRTLALSLLNSTFTLSQKLAALGREPVCVLVGELRSQCTKGKHASPTDGYIFNHCQPAI